MSTERVPGCAQTAARLVPCRWSSSARARRPAAPEFPGAWDDLLVYTDRGTWAARGIINATGTWTTPNWPWYPGAETFAGRQLHVVQYVTADEFAGQHVVVVGGGISAIQLLAEVSAVTTTTWVTRRPPVWFDGEFTPETEGRTAVARAEADARAGRPIGSVVSYTGLFWTPTRGPPPNGARCCATRCSPRSSRTAC